MEKPNLKKHDNLLMRYPKSVLKQLIVLFVFSCANSAFSQYVSIPYYNWGVLYFTNKPCDNFDLVLEDNSLMDWWTVTSVGEIKSFHDFLLRERISSITIFDKEKYRDDTDTSNSYLTFNYKKNEIEINIEDDIRNELINEKISFKDNLIKEITSKRMYGDMLSDSFNYKCLYEYDNKNSLKSIQVAILNNSDSLKTNYNYFYDKKGRLILIKKIEKTPDSLITSEYNFIYHKDSIITVLNNKIVNKYILNKTGTISCKYYYEYDQSNNRYCSRKETFLDDLVVISLFSDAKLYVEYYYTYKNGVLIMTNGGMNRDFPEGDSPIFSVSRSFCFENNYLTTIKSIQIYSLGSDNCVEREMKYTYQFR